MRALFSAAVLAALTIPAASADLESPVEIWSGMYIGAHVGYGWGETGVDLSNSIGAIFYGDPFVPDQGKLKSKDGFVGGLGVGADQQFGGIVAGIALDVSWGGLESEGTFTTPLGSQWAITSEINTLAMARGRLGLLVTPAMLVYGTAGVAWANVDVTQATTFVAGSGCAPLGSAACEGGRTSGNYNHVGYVIGGGLEYAVGRGWSIKAEYLHVNLGDQDYGLTGTTKPGGSVPYTETFASDLTLDVVRAGLNYRF